jgi:hypothetical protein
VISAGLEKDSTMTKRKAKGYKRYGDDTMSAQLRAREGILDDPLPVSVIAELHPDNSDFAKQLINAHVLGGLAAEVDAAALQCMLDEHIDAEEFDLSAPSTYPGNGEWLLVYRDDLQRYLEVNNMWPLNQNIALALWWPRNQHKDQAPATPETLQKKPSALDCYFNYELLVLDRRLAIFEVVLLEYAKAELLDQVKREFKCQPKDSLSLDDFNLPLTVSGRSRGMKSGKEVLFTKCRELEEEYREGNQDRIKPDGQRLFVERPNFDRSLWTTHEVRRLCRTAGYLRLRN